MEKGTKIALWIVGGVGSAIAIGLGIKSYFNYLDKQKAEKARQDDAKQVIENTPNVNTVITGSPKSTTPKATTITTPSIAVGLKVYANSTMNAYKSTLPVSPIFKQYSNGNLIGKFAKKVGNFYEVTVDVPNNPTGEYGVSSGTHQETAYVLPTQVRF